MKTFQHRNAKTYREAIKLLQGYGGKARAIAGGTDLLGALKDKILPDYPQAVINLKSIPGMDHVKENGRSLKIGALARLADVAVSPVVKTRFPILAEAAHAVATPQVRNMATIGGNLCQDTRCWYYRYPHQVGGRIFCYLKGGKGCYALNGENQYHSIFGGCRIADPPCTQACPGTINIAAYLDRIREGDLPGAARILLMNNPIPAVTGRVCPHWCEQDCNRKDFDLSVSIWGVERFMGDYILDHSAEIVRPPEKQSGKKVAVVGSGPAGLAAACYLRMAGHSVTVFDKMPEAGGFLTYAIPAYRLPKDVVKRTIEVFKLAGVEFKLNTELGKDVTLDGLRKAYDAVFLATGAWRQRSIGLAEEHLTKPGLEFLRNASAGLEHAAGKKVLVIGGGNVAVDVGITAKRLGAAEVTLACLECQAEMPAFPSEIEQAIEEGVKFKPSWGPARVLVSHGEVTGMELVCCTSVFDKEGRFNPSYDTSLRTTVEADIIIMAVGQAADLSYLGSPPALKTERGLVAVNLQTLETGLTGVFAGGEVVIGPSSVIASVAAGRRAAAAINQYLGGGAGVAQAAPQAVAQASSPVFAVVRQASLPVGAELPPQFLKFNPSCLTHSDHVPQPKLPVSGRGIAIEDMAGLDSAGTETEAGRCFNCGCVAVNPSDMAVALMALGAKVRVAGPEGMRTVAVEDFFAATGRELKPDEIVTEIQVPSPPPGSRQVFEKFRVRESVDFPIVSVACVLNMKDGVCKDARIVLGAVAPAPFRARAAEQAVKGKPLAEDTAAAAAEAALSGALPLLKNQYKVQITRTLVKRALLGAP
ncbi:MAG: FAD binding domain-containing protein [Chloroflexi bacterium]|nr:FAD binding domain-containing protein [Chloroflexota bacterium]